MSSSKLRLIIDMDGVMADVYHQFIHMEEAASGSTINRESLIGIPEYTAFPNGRKHVNQQGFFLQAPLMPGALETLQALNEKYEVFIVSAAMEFPNSLPEKYSWLRQHFPFLQWQQWVFCGSKSVIKGDIMIDDHFRNLDQFKGRTLLFSQPHNMATHDHNHERVNGWKEVASLLL